MMEPPVLTLRIPNPFFEGRNQVYVIRSDPVTLIDTGIATQRAFAALEQELARHGLALRDIGRVILTHKHIDHIGNAWRIQRETGAQILIHESDLPDVREVDPAGRQFRDLAIERLRQWQAPEQPAGSFGPKWEIESATPTPLVDGQRLNLGGSELEVIHTPGHTLGSVCLKYGRRLFSGDHVLQHISPNIGGGDMRHRGLLQHYLRSLQRAMDFAVDVDQILPGHGEPFDQLHPRCQELLDHHRQRLQQVEALLRSESPQSVFRVACGLFGKLRDFHVVLGCAEAQAHLEFLMDEGRVVCDRETNGLAEYRLV